jgi:hypothetical protein
MVSRLTNRLIKLFFGLTMRGAYKVGERSRTLLNFTVIKHNTVPHRTRSRVHDPCSDVRGPCVPLARIVTVS